MLMNETSARDSCNNIKCLRIIGRNILGMKSETCSGNLEVYHKVK